VTFGLLLGGVLLSLLKTRQPSPPGSADEPPAKRP
jgi:xanthosine utilization system XapX-like protein